MLEPAFPAAGLEPFQPRIPWLGGDLQTLRDSLRPQRLPADQGREHRFLLDGGDQLLGCFDAPLRTTVPRALVVVVHGLAGSSDRIGPRRLALTLQRCGFAVLRLNLRGAGPGRALARGSYAAQCNRDLVPVLRQLRQLAAGVPLMGVGLSLGGTILLNAVLHAARDEAREALLDALVCISSPLDLQACAHQIARPRNRIYERWLLRRLVAEVAADPHGLSSRERAALQQRQVGSIRGFDAAITAPRWGYRSVEAYYEAASPGPRLLARSRDLPPTLIVHALDDPWVPAAAAQQLHSQIVSQGQQGRLPGCPLEVRLTSAGGHNGFHGTGDAVETVVAAPGGCWSDRLAAHWLQDQLTAEGAMSLRE